MQVYRLRVAYLETCPKKIDILNVWIQWIQYATVLACPSLYEQHKLSRVCWLFLTIHAGKLIDMYSSKYFCTQLVLMLINLQQRTTQMTTGETSPSLHLVKYSIHPQLNYNLFHVIYIVVLTLLLHILVYNLRGFIINIFSSTV